MSTADDTADPDRAGAERRGYAAPTLTRLGRLCALTTGGSGARPEFFGVSPRRQPRP